MRACRAACADMCAHLGEGGAVSHHELVGGGQAVRHVQKGQRGVGPQEAVVGAGRERRMEYLHRVVCGAAPGEAGRGYDARVAQRSEVHAEFLAVVLPQQLLVHLMKGNFVRDTKHDVPKTGMEVPTAVRL